MGAITEGEAYKWGLYIIGGLRSGGYNWGGLKTGGYNWGGA